MTRLPLIAAVLLVTACGQQEPAAPAANEASSAASAPAAADAVPTLEGQWSVAAIDGNPVDAGSAMTASFASGKAAIASGCVRRSWTYTQKRNVIAFAADPGGSSNCEGRGTTGEQETAYAALQDSTIAIFNKDGSQADLSGTGGNLTLKRR